MTRTDLHPFICKRFANNQWCALGVVYARDESEAWRIAIKTWGKVDSVWDLYTAD